MKKQHQIFVANYWERRDRSRTGLNGLFGRPIAGRAAGRKPTASVTGLQLRLPHPGFVSTHFAPERRFRSRASGGP